MFSCADIFYIVVISSDKKIKKDLLYLLANAAILSTPLEVVVPNVEASVWDNTAATVMSTSITNCLPRSGNWRTRAVDFRAS